MKPISKHDYFKNLAEFETAELFLTEKTDSVQTEIEYNCFGIGLGADLAKEITVDDFLLFLSRVKSNRQKQLTESRLKIDLLYYLWYDEMAGLLRFNFINSNHQKLPFVCQLSLVSNELEIVTKFLNDHLQIAEQELPNDPYILPVYKQVIKGDESF